jgi:hypothetical protein
MLAPEKSLAIILGVSKCPRATNLDPLPQCAASARAFEEYLRTSLHISSANVLNLFDSSDSASDQLDQIEDWLAQALSRTLTPTDLMLYYTGHGGFARNDQSYFLAVQKTRRGSEGATSIRYVDLASSVKRHADHLRKYLILDCCFAASAVIGTQADLGQMVIDRVSDELPPYGTAVLCSSAAKLFSIAPPGDTYTMFSGAFLQCLREGIPNGPEVLTLEDVGKRTRELIQLRYPSDSVRPELHVPEQSRGNPARVPLFPNVGWMLDDSRDSTVADVANQSVPARSERSSDSPRTTPIAAPFRRAIAGVASGLVTSLIVASIEYPLRSFDFLPIAPPVGLSLALLYSMNTVSRINIKIAAAVFICTFLVWTTVCVIFRLLTISFGSASSIIAMSLGGFLGSWLLAVAVLAVRRVRPMRLALAARHSLPLAAIAGLAMCWLVVVGDTHDKSFSFLVLLFVSWHTWYVVVFAPKVLMSADALSFRGVAGLSVAFGIVCALLSIKPVRTELDTFVVPSRSLILVVQRVDRVSPQHGLIVNYILHKKNLGPLWCSLRVTINATTYQGRREVINDDFTTGSTTVDFGEPVNVDRAPAQFACSDLRYEERRYNSNSVNISWRVD